MKSIWGWNDIRIHPFTILLFIIAIYYKTYHFLLGGMVITIIHELFHYYFAKKYKFKTKKITILPFGTNLILLDYGQHHIIEEFIVILAGLISHFFIFLFLLFFFNHEEFLKMNALIFAFNLLPIYPLDGSKLILLFLSMVMDYQKAIKLQIKISIFFISICLMTIFKINMMLVFLFLIIENYYYIKTYRVHIIRLLLSRRKPLYRKFHWNHNDDFYRTYQNIYIQNNKCYNEAQKINDLLEKIVD